MVERGSIRKVVDKVGYGVAYVSGTFGVIGGVGALMTGNIPLAALAAGFVFLDYTQIRQHGLPPEKQSWYNPERILDKVSAMIFKQNRGSNHFKQPYSSAMLRATA